CNQALEAKLNLLAVHDDLDSGYG
ncbi:MAG: hypothetical protein RLZZ41_257, partial [Actinomycetota bacterium]